MSIDANQLLERAVAIAQEAITIVGLTSDGYPFFWHTQTSYPYVTARIGAVEVGEDGEELDTYAYTVTLRIVIGHFTENYNGALETKLYEIIPVLIQRINERELLQSAAFPLAMDSIDFARVVGAVGYGVFGFSPAGSPQIGGEVSLRATFTEPLTQATFNQE